LKTTLDKLVPSEMPLDEFWHRYFFRVHQIQDEEDKRKALLEASTQGEEDFSWDDDEESAVSPMEAKAERPVSYPPTMAHSTSMATIKADLAEPSPTSPNAAKDAPAKSANATPVVDQSSTFAPTTTLSPPKEAHGSPISAPPSSLAASPRESEDSYDLLSGDVRSKDASSDDSDWE